MDKLGITSAQGAQFVMEMNVLMKLRRQSGVFVMADYGCGPKPAARGAKIVSHTALTFYLYGRCSHTCGETDTATNDEV